MVAVLTGYRATGQVSDLSPSQDNHFPYLKVIRSGASRQRVLSPPTLATTTLLAAGFGLRHLEKQEKATRVKTEQELQEEEEEDLEEVQRVQQQVYTLNTKKMPT